MKHFITLTSLLILFPFISKGQTAQDNNSNHRTTSSVQYRLDSLEGLIWDGDNKKWTSVSMKRYSYNLQGEMLESISSLRFVYNYNEDGTPIERFYYFDKPYSQRNESYLYDEQGNITCILISLRENFENQWKYYSKLDYEYDQYGNKISKTLSYYYTAVGFQPDIKYETKYNIYNDPQEEILMEWDVSKSKWGTDTTRYTNQIVYDENNNMSSFVVYYLNKSTGKIEPGPKLEFLFDKNKNLLERVFHNYTPKLKMIYKYDLSMNISKVQFPPLVDFVKFPDNVFGKSEIHHLDYMQCRPLEFITYRFDDETDTYNQTGKQVFHYSTHKITATDEIPEKSALIFPNPVTDHILISLNKNSHAAVFSLFDSSGRKILTKNIKNNQKLSLSGINAGIYFYTIATGSNIENGKLIKQ